MQYLLVHILDICATSEDMLEAGQSHRVFANQPWFYNSWHIDLH